MVSPICIVAEGRFSVIEATDEGAVGLLLFVFEQEVSPISARLNARMLAFRHPRQRYGIRVMVMGLRLPFPRTWDVQRGVMGKTDGLKRVRGERVQSEVPRELAAFTGIGRLGPVY